MKNIICAANPLKEVLSATDCLAALTAGAGRVITADEITGYIISDGGDGFLDAVSQSQEFERLDVECTAPLGDVVTAPVLIDRAARTAYIESATCCGISLVEPARRDILMSGTAGLADLLAAGRDAGAERIAIGLGGSATCDGGVGFIWQLACLAGQFRANACDPRVAIDLAESGIPDLEQITSWLGDIQLIACADVDNPLTGPEGAARIYGPQKGADAEQVDQLDAWISGWCERIERVSGRSFSQIPGTGAAGGLGFALMAIGAEIIPGASAVADQIGLRAALRPGSHVFTNEGRFDSTSFRGKAPWTIAQLAKEAGASAVIFAAFADPAAKQRAEAEGIHVIEFGAGLGEEERKSRSAELLNSAVAGYLESGQAQL